MGARNRRALPPVFRREGGRLFLGRVHLWCAALLLSALHVQASSPIARAQDKTRTESPPPSGEQIPPTQLPEVRVEAEAIREKEASRDSTAASSVITRDEMEKSAQEIPDLVNREVGVQSFRVGGFGSFSSVSIRGSSADQVRVFLDGVPLNRGVSQAVNLSILQAELLDRIEIYRGIAPLSVGGSAIGGVIELQTRAPERDALEIFGGGGSWGFRQAGVYGSAVQDEGPWSGLFSLVYEGAENDFEFINDAGTPGVAGDDFIDEVGNGDYDRGDALIQINRALNGGGELALSQVFSISERGLTFGPDPSTPTKPRLDTLFSNTLARMTLPGPVPLSEFEARGYLSVTRTQLNDPDSALSATTTSLDTDDRDWLFGAGLLYRQWLRDDLKLEAFGDYSFELFQATNKASNTSSQGPGSVRHGWNLAVGLEWEPIPQLLLLIAQARVEAVHDFLHEANTGKPIDDEVSRVAPTGRLGLKYRAADPLTLFVNVANAVRFPTFIELFGTTGLFEGNPDLEEEHSFNVDGGFELAGVELPWSAFARAELRYFYSKKDDLIVFERRPNGAVTVENVSGARLHGLEVVGEWRAERLLRLQGNLTWLASAQEGNADFEVPFTPELNIYLRASLEHEFGGKTLTRAGFYADWQYLSDYFANRANLITLGERSLLGAGFYADFLDGNLRAVFEARNLTDELNIENFSRAPLPGRTFIGTLRWRAL